MVFVTLLILLRLVVVSHAAFLFTRTRGSNSGLEN